jgi:nucleotide-binding universal stress UspA family protein
MNRFMRRSLGAIRWCGLRKLSGCVAAGAGMTGVNGGRADNRARHHPVLSNRGSIAMYQRILVPVDGSETSNAGLAEAVKLAKLTGAQLRLVHVVDETPFLMSAEGMAAISTDVLGLLREGGERILEAARAYVVGQGVAADTKLYDGLSNRLSDCVNEQVAQWNADLIVLGTHGRRGVGRMLLGSGAEQVARTATVPVLLVRARPPAAA